MLLKYLTSICIIALVLLAITLRWPGSIDNIAFLWLYVAGWLPSSLLALVEVIDQRSFRRNSDQFVASLFFPIVVIAYWAVFCTMSVKRRRLGMRHFD